MKQRVGDDRTRDTARSTGALVQTGPRSEDSHLSGAKSHTALVPTSGANASTGPNRRLLQLLTSVVVRGRRHHLFDSFIPTRNFFAPSDMPAPISASLGIS